MAFVDHAADGIAILLWSAGPERPDRLHTPFLFAAAAAAMVVPVEIYFTAGSVRLLQPGVAEGLQAAHHQKDVATAMREASMARRIAAPSVTPVARILKRAR